MGRQGAATPTAVLHHPRRGAIQERKRFDEYVTWAAMPETTRLNRTIAWWPEIATFIDTRATNARTEATNVAVKHTKRTGRGYRSPANYQCRIMLYNAARSAA